MVSIQNFDIKLCYFLQLVLCRLCPVEKSISVLVFYQIVIYLVGVFAGCSFLGVGMKFSPLDSRDISPGVNLCLFKLMMWVRVLLNLLWCFVFSVAVVFACLGLFSLCSSFSSDLVWSLWIYSLLYLVFCSIVLGMSLVSLYS